MMAILNMRWRCCLFPWHLASHAPLCQEVFIKSSLKLSCCSFQPVTLCPVLSTVDTGGKLFFSSLQQPRTYLQTARPPFSFLG